MKQFVENRIKFLLLPLVIIAVGVVMYFVHGGFNFDIEFMGGIRMEVDMGKDISNDEISDAVSGVLSENGKVDPSKLNALIFDQFQHGYYVSGEQVGKAWNAGAGLMKK